MSSNARQAEGKSDSLGREAGKARRGNEGEQTKSNEASNKSRRRNNVGGRVTRSDEHNKTNVVE